MAQTVLKALDAQADGGLGHEQPITGRHERPGIGHFDKGLDKGDIHGAAP